MIFKILIKLETNGIVITGELKIINFMDQGLCYYQMEKVIPGILIMVKYMEQEHFIVMMAPLKQVFGKIINIY